MPKWIPQLHDAEWLRSAYSTKNTWQIAEELGCSQSAVSYALKRNGIEARESGHPQGPNELDDSAWLRTQYAEKTTREIARMLRCSQITVWKALKRHDIATRPNHARTKEDSEMKAHYRAGKDSQGVYKKHRRIIEEHLGRKLERWEHVHHIDGNGLNNSLDNLVVLTKRLHHKLHGPKVKFSRDWYDFLHFPHTCARCGVSFKGGNRAKYCPNCR